GKSSSMSWTTGKPHSSWTSVILFILPELRHRHVVHGARVQGESVENLRHDLVSLFEVLGFPVALGVLAHDQVRPTHPDPVVLVLSLRLSESVEVRKVRDTLNTLLPGKVTDLRPHRTPLRWRWELPPRPPPSR